MGEWTDNTDFYKNIDYKNEWLDEDATITENVDVVQEKNILYEKLNLKYDSMFNGPKLFHKEQTRRKKGI
ncbi:hypothetical protein AAJ76_150002787 [Vairimorpha ceranae]|uniref:Uncharacterized protein n=1 Tax=Vairimorpha ceranae TaxID=40302 RepID=A0A0F9YSU8_9MICR|nr:hypothetical protein AAJ76_150002787 [Vairimorpha ceranae]KAF5140463.1 hypothetical protein G9O61_00g012680 [Vairimorpha ceranae]KKO75637.1 hypothetical protein AAJ76_150002787 [Vairimorpha ceranae]